jgi:hypothetical protein
MIDTKLEKYLRKRNKKEIGQSDHLQKSSRQPHEYNLWQYTKQSGVGSQESGV